MGIVARAVRSALPLRHQPAARYAYERLRGLLERELPLAIAAVRPGERAVDVGANAGLYTYAFARAGAAVEAFEPQAGWIAVLRAFAASRPQVRVHQIALGADNRVEQLFVPVQAGRSQTGRASLRGDSGSSRVESVQMRKLDDFDLGGVAIMKIDVEGAELGVLEGGSATIERYQPLLLVEIEQRHHRRSIADVFRRVSAFGYTGSFLDGGGRLASIDQFDVERHQVLPLANSAAGPYINNFLFQAAASGRRWVG